MLRRAALLAAVLPALATGADCRTPYNNSPCFTLRYTQSLWAFEKSPVREFVKTEHKGVLAMRADGSMASITDAPDRFALRDNRQPAGRATILYLAGANRLVRDNVPDLDDYRHGAPLVWTGPPAPRTSPADTTCAAAAREFGIPFTPDGTANLHGQPVARWTHKSKLLEAALALAPGLNCQPLSYSRIEYRYRFVPVRHELFEATSVTIGDPDAALFAVPKGK